MKPSKEANKGARVTRSRIRLKAEDVAHEIWVMLEGTKYQKPVSLKLSELFQFITKQAKRNAARPGGLGAR